MTIISSVPRTAHRQFPVKVHAPMPEHQMMMAKTEKVFTNYAPILKFLLHSGGSVHDCGAMGAGRSTARRRSDRPRCPARAWSTPVSYTHLRAHETGRNLVCRLLLEKKKP